MKITPKAIYAGTFDPFTNGHQDIAIRALDIFGSILIVVAAPDEKTPFLDPKKRVEMINQIFAKRVDVIRAVMYDRLIVDFARKNHIKILIRGLRPNGDFDSEFQMATMNKNLNPDIETVFITTGKKSYYVSSSLVREVFKYSGDISPFVHPIVQEEMERSR